LVTQRRFIEIDNPARTITLTRRSLYRSVIFSTSYDEVDEIRLTIDEIQSGFAVGGSTAAQKFPVPALRLALANGDSVLLDRGSFRKLSEFGKLISERLGNSLAIDPQLTT
jgi:hypothetical protein